jgi:hypothetical protein
MNHPEREEWVPYICNEADRETRRRLKQHLAQCPECAELVAGWRRSLERLGRWRLARPLDRTPAYAFPVLKWAAVGALMLGLGIFIGRAGPRPELQVAALRTQMEASVRSSIAEELQLAMLEMQARNAKALAATEAGLIKAAALEKERVWTALLEVINDARDEDRQLTRDLLQDLQDQYRTEFVSLRQDLETLASTTDEEMRQARWKLIQLAASAQGD